MLKAILFLVLLNLQALASPTKSSRIEDNSVFLEEAYNQRQGTLQFIQTLQWNKKSRSFIYDFATEFPLGDEEHQFSYTIPVSFKKADSHAQGVGDVSLEYRRQWLHIQDELLMASKFLLFTPTGSVKRGLGTGHYGFKINHALTAILSPDWVAHGNLGTIFYPTSQNAQGGTDSTLGFNYGVSLFYMRPDTFNLFTELYATDDEVLKAGDDRKVGKTDQYRLIINPGLRWAINHDGGSQLVPGISFPYTFGSAGVPTERGVLLYLSFEDKYW